MTNNNNPSVCPDCGGESYHHTVECFTGSIEQIVELDENLDLAEELGDEPDTEDVTRYGVYFD